MTLVGRDAIEFEKRREASHKRASESPRSGATVAMGVMKSAFSAPALGYFTEGAMLKAQCKRLANRAHVIGNTAFKFDDKGITRVINHGNVLHDFNELLKLNGVVELDPDTEQPKPTDHMRAEPVAPPAPAPVKTEAKVMPIAEARRELDLPPVDEEMEASPPDLVVGAVEEEEPAEESKPVEKDSRRKPATKK